MGMATVLSKQKRALKGNKKGADQSPVKRPGSRSGDISLDFLKNRTIKKMTPPKGFNNMRTVLAAARLARAGKSIDLIAKRVGMSESSVADCLNRELRKSAMKVLTAKEYVLDQKRCFATHKRQA